MEYIDVAEKLEKIIAIYFNGNNYILDGVELSREDSKILAFSLIHAYQITERIMSKKYNES